MKIGLKFISVSDGTGDLFPVINNGTWNRNSNFILELGTKLKSIGIGENDTSTVSIGFKYIPEGQLICLVRRMLYRGSANRSYEALWIFIPSQVVLKPEELQEILSETEKMFTNETAFRSSQQFEASVPDLYHKDFPASGHPFTTGNMAGDKVASIVSTPQWPPIKILDYGYQNVYVPFGLILLNMTGHREPGATVIEPSQIRKQVWVKWPVALPQKLEGVKSFALYIDRKPMSPDGMSVIEGQHEVILVQQGFEPVMGKITVTVPSDNLPLTFGPEWNSKRWMKKVEPSKFHIISSRGQSLIREVSFRSPDTFDASGNPKTTFRSNETVYVPANRLKDFTLDVIVPGYEPVSDEFDLTGTGTVSVSMIPKVEKGVVDANYNGMPVRVTVEGVGANRMMSDGFSLRNGRLDTGMASHGAMLSLQEDNRKLVKALAKERGQKKLWLIIACVLGAIAIALLCVWLGTRPSEEPEDLKYVPQKSEAVKNDSNVGQQEEDNQQKESVIGSIGEDKDNDNSDQLANDSKEIAKAVNYLEERKNWAFDEMEATAALKGLYNDLNTFNFANIKNKWAERLKGSKKFNDLVEEVKMSDKDEYRNNFVGLYVKSGEAQIINYKNYLFYISNQRKKETSSNAQVKNDGHTSGGSNKGTTNSGTTQRGGNNNSQIGLGT